MSGCLAALGEALVIVPFIQGAGRLKDPTRLGFPERCIRTNSPRDAEINKEQGEILRIDRALKNGY